VRGSKISKRHSKKREKKTITDAEMLVDEKEKKKNGPAVALKGVKGGRAKREVLIRKKNAVLAGFGMPGMDGIVREESSLNAPIPGIHKRKKNDNKEERSRVSIGTYRHHRICRVLGKKRVTSKTRQKPTGKKAIEVWSLALGRSCSTPRKNPNSRKKEARGGKGWSSSTRAQHRQEAQFAGWEPAWRMGVNNHRKKKKCF